MPELVWQPRSFDSRQVYNQRDTWNGYHGILDDDRLTNMAPLKTDSALNPGGGFNGYWINGFDKDPFEDYGVMVSKGAGATWNLHLFTDHTLGALLTGALAFSFIETNLNIGFVHYGAFPVVHYSVISGSTQLHLIDPNTPAVTAIPGTTRADFLVKHLTRIVAALIRVVSWSIPADPSDWTSTGSGSADIGEDIFGLAVTDNYLTILCRNSVHYGFLTGSTSPTYRFERVLSDTDVCSDMHSVAQYGNAVFCRGWNGVYKIERGTIENIGEPAWHIIRPFKANVFRGVVLHQWQDSTTARPNSEDPHYVLFPVTDQGGTQATVPVLAYNINKKVWNAFYMGAAVNLAMAYVSRQHLHKGVEILGLNTDQISYFSTSTGTVSRNTSLKSPVMEVDGPLQDYATDQLFIWYTDTGQFTVSVTVTCLLNDTVQTLGPTSVTLGNSSATNRILKERVPIRGITGQQFQIEISSTTASTLFLCIVKVMLTCKPAGDYRGA